MSRPVTQGCTELSCIYHGGENRFKSAHAPDCPIYSFSGFVMDAFDASTRHLVPTCTCRQRMARTRSS